MSPRVWLRAGPPAPPICHVEQGSHVRPSPHPCARPFPRSVHNPATFAWFFNTKLVQLHEQIEALEIGADPMKYLGYRAQPQ